MGKDRSFITSIGKNGYSYMHKKKTEPTPNQNKHNKLNNVRPETIANNRQKTEKNVGTLL